MIRDSLVTGRVGGHSRMLKESSPQMQVERQLRKALVVDKK